jgi:hypothetical protein
MSRMKTKTRKRTARAKFSKTVPPKKARARQRATTASTKLHAAPSKTAARRDDETQSTPAGEKKIATMPNRTSGMKADINTRFSSADDYQKVKASAAAAGVSMNKFIVDAALDRVRKMPVTGSEGTDPTMAEPVATAG